MSYVKTQDNVNLYVKDWGTGRPVIMMHGWPLSADSFDDLAMAIAASGMRAITYDRRGFGRSGQPWTGYDYDTLADDLAAVLQQTGAKDATLVGFSMGGGEVARYMSRHGKSVRQAVLIASVVPYLLQTEDNPHGVDRDTLDGMAKGIKQDRAKFWGTFFKDFYGVGIVSHPVSDETLEWSRAMAMQASLKATLDCAAAFATTDFRPDLAAFAEIPTLIIHGTKDKTVPIDASGRAAAAGIAASEFLEYEGAPHGLLATHKERVISDVLRFLQTDARIESRWDTQRAPIMGTAQAVAQAVGA